nr:malonyl-CoA decarboxylase family protein [Mesorhizobium ciceri]
MLPCATAWVRPCFLLRHSISSEARSASGKVIDPVARFHLGNGARLERIDLFGDLSPRALRQAHGLMVNYRYKLDDIEKNHELFAARNDVAAAPAVRRLLPKPARPAAPPLPAAQTRRDA